MEVLGVVLVLGAMLWLMAFMVKGRLPGMPRLPGGGSGPRLPRPSLFSRFESSGLLRAVSLVVIAELIFSDPFADWLATGTISPAAGAAALLVLGVACVFFRGPGDILLGILGLIAGSWAIAERYGVEMLLVVGAVALMIAWISGAVRRVTG